MKKRPVKCLRGHPELQSLALRPVHEPVDLEKGLAMEAALTAAAWSDCAEGIVRGGPWCLQNLPDPDVSEIGLCIDAFKKLKSKSLEIQSLAVVDVAQNLPRSSSLVRHLKCECFRCAKHLTRCTCRGLGRRDACLTSPRRHQPGKSGRYKPGARRGRRNASGKHKPGVPRQSGNKGPRKSGKSHKSGSQSSGSEKRLSKLPPAVFWKWSAS